MNDWHFLFGNGEYIAEGPREVLAALVDRLCTATHGVEFYYFSVCR